MGGRVYSSQYQYIHNFEYDGINMTHTVYTYSNVYVSTQLLDASLWGIDDGVISLDISTTVGGLWPVLFLEIK